MRKLSRLLVAASAGAMLATVSSGYAADKSPSSVDASQPAAPHRTAVSVAAKPSERTMHRMLKTQRADAQQVGVGGDTPMAPSQRSMHSQLRKTTAHSAPTER